MNGPPTASDLHQAVLQHLREAGRLSPQARLRQSESIGGGCISHAEVLSFDDGSRYFVKSNPSPLPGMFEAECAGLAALARPQAIKVPQCIVVGREPLPFIVMEHVATGPRPGTFSESFGRAFATLHQAEAGSRFGFDGDNYLGSTPQPNGWLDDWVDFFRTRRLGFQLDLARDNGVCTPELSELGERLLGRLGELLAGSAEPPCLLHGDLWSGNYLCDDTGHAVLIDPAAYRGHREADLAMTRLFGGFDQRFYSAYEEQWPLAPGSEERLELYKLYHLLNHLNLFGSGYLSGCLSIMRRFT